MNTMANIINLVIFGFAFASAVLANPLLNNPDVLDDIEVFEGDIKLDEETKGIVRKHYSSFADASASLNRGAGVPGDIRLWDVYPENGNFIVPYVLDSSLNSQGRQAIEDAAADFERYTCIRLVPRTNQQNYITYFRENGCWSPIGMRSSDHKISIGNNCEYKGIAIHETMHSLGFWHEQSRPDRDSYVVIHYENIRSNMAFNFDKRESDEINSLNSPYDIGSVMHYQSTAFSSNGQRTISTIDGQDFDAQRDGFAQTDIDQINALYGCGTIEPTTTTSVITTTEAPTTTSAPVTPITLPELQCTTPDRLNKQTCLYLSYNVDCTDLFMTQYCCQSCKNLGGIVYPPTRCEDKDRRCRSHAARGFCDKIPTMMADLCARTCGLC